jgi:hypothetical protein
MIAMVFFLLFSNIVSRFVGVKDQRVSKRGTVNGVEEEPVVRNAPFAGRNEIWLPKRNPLRNVLCFLEGSKTARLATFVLTENIVGQEVEINARLNSAEAQDIETA